MLYFLRVKMFLKEFCYWCVLFLNVPVSRLSFRFNALYHFWLYVQLTYPVM